MALIYELSVQKVLISRMTLSFHFDRKRFGDVSSGGGDWGGVDENMFIQISAVTCQRKGSGILDAFAEKSHPRVLLHDFT